VGLQKTAVDVVEPGEEIGDEGGLEAPIKFHVVLLQQINQTAFRAEFRKNSFVVEFRTKAHDSIDVFLVHAVKLEGGMFLMEESMEVVRQSKKSYFAQINEKFPGQVNFAV
jgi:hypothetical protein